jgi:hypothetical protein
MYAFKTVITRKEWDRSKKESKSDVAVEYLIIMLDVAFRKLH